MNEVENYEVVLAKHASHFLRLKGFADHAFFCSSKEAVRKFGDEVYFIEKHWLEWATKEVYGW